MQIILIGGAQRSGTTILQTLVANALNAPALPEAHILCDLLRAYKKAKDRAATAKVDDRPEDLRRFFDSVIETHIRDLAAQYDEPKHLVLKDPNFAEVMGEIAELLPGSTRVLCVRDPRDIVSSFLKIGQRQAGQPAAHSTKPASDPGCNQVRIAIARNADAPVLQVPAADDGGRGSVVIDAPLLCDLLRVYRRAKSEWTKTSKFYGSRDDLDRFFRSVIEEHVSTIAMRYDTPSNLVLRDPKASGMMWEFFELVPQARRVGGMRDVVASLFKLGKREGERRYTRRDLRSLCKKINAAYAGAFSGRLADGVAVARYEHVVTDSAGALQRLAAETGLPLQLNRTDELVWLEAEFRHQETWITDLEGRPPTQDSIGSFRHLLSDTELARVERMCRDVMERFEYEPAAVQRPARVIERFTRLLKGLGMDAPGNPGA